MKTMWAIGQDYGSYEGQRPPLTLVETREQALAIKKLFSEVYSSSVYVIEVPIWPDVKDTEQLRQEMDKS